MNGGGFEMLSRTSVPQLPPLYLSPPRTKSVCGFASAGQGVVAHLQNWWLYLVLFTVEYIKEQKKFQAQTMWVSRLIWTLAVYILYILHSLHIFFQQ